MRTPAERSIEVLMWSSIIIWLGLALLADLLVFTWLITIVLSVILLSSAIYQHSQGWHTSLGIWVFGIWMAVFSVIEIVSELIAAITGTDGLNIDLGVYLGVALVSMGVASVFRTIRVGGQGGAAYAPDQTGRQRTTSTATGNTRSRSPRRMDTQSNSAYTPPVRGQSGRRSSRQPADYRTNQDDQFDQALEEYGYDEPEAANSRGSSRADSSARTGRQSAYTTGRQQSAQRTARQPASRTPQRGGRQDDYGYTPANEVDDYGGPTQSLPDSSRTPRRTDDRRRANPVGGRREAPASDTSSELESRVEDIIRRSRDRRTQPPEDLPY
ncbi:MAG: hypothetical protein HY866_22780 [Chloroflexi bacterium]|nr:hypothetical protein [Chloroflexota bacterium]